MNVVEPDFERIHKKDRLRTILFDFQPIQINALADPSPPCSLIVDP